jgi:SAM-dependent methyltransferase
MNLNVQKHMVECPTCNEDAYLIYSLENKGVLGIADEYNQEIAVCENCDFIFTVNPINKDILDEFYKKLSNYEYSAGGGGLSKSFKKMIGRQYNFISPYLNNTTSVLEIGAADGYNLKYYKDYGYKVYGIEPSAANQKIVKDNFDIDMYQGTFEEYLQEDISDSFELIFMSHVLEHINNPKIFLKEVRKLNSRYIYIEVPSMDARFNEEPFGSFFFEHINYFTYESIVNLMSSVGYSSEKFCVDYTTDGSSPGHPVIMSLWKKEKEVDFSRIRHSIYSSSNLVSQYFKDSKINFEKIKSKINIIPPEKKIAVWGTGSHTSRLLGMTNLFKRNIVKFYDSDVKKQQFTLLGKEITAFNEDDIKDGVVDTIVVSTFSGEKSILDFIKTLDVNVDVVSLYH